jgi:chromosome segregation protein
VLKLKKLQMLGFKSFCDRTELQFPGTGVVGVVGPNGCGKSNLADAISWVLGEQSAKSLRGGRMEDVIFAGTRERPATGMAEVSLTLVDPAEYEFETIAGGAAAEEESADEATAEDDAWGEAAETALEDADVAGAAAAEAAPNGVVLTIRKRRKFRAHNRKGEVVVTRRLFRDGQSEYLMNGRPCRLRDIQDLFLGTGLGPDSYAIIEQGRIGQILSSKPYDRRAILEEAAGVSKYKAKRRLAEARLESARQNLARINDIFEEVTRQVNSLKRQAAKAQRYRQIKAELEAHQRRLLRAKADALAALAAELRQAQAAAQAETQAAQAEIAEREAAQQAAAARGAELERDLRQGAETAARLKGERDQAEQQIAYDTRQALELAAREAERGEQARRLEAQALELERELEEAARAQQAAAGRLAGAAAVGDQRRAAEHEAARALAELESALESARRDDMALMARQATLGAEAAQCEARQAEIERQLERWAAEADAAGRELEAGGERAGQLSLAFQDQESARRQVEAQIAAIEQRLAATQAALAAEREAAQRARTGLAETAARRKSLEEIVAQRGASSDAVQHLFAAGAAAGLRPLGVLSEFVEAEPPYDRVVEQFLRDELNYVVVGSWDEAAAGLEMLRRGEQGRATFLVHADAGAGADAAAGAAVAGARPLLQEVRATNGFRNSLGAILPRLRSAFCVEDAARARALALEHPAAYFLTPDGDCFHHATLSGGAAASRGPLSLKRELRELTRAEAQAQADCERRERQAASLTLEAEALAAELERARTERHELEKQLLTSGQQVRQLEQEMARAQARRAQAELELERSRDAGRRAGERHAAARAGLAEVAGAQEAARQRAASATGALAAARAARETAAAARSAAEADQARAEEQARAAAATLARGRQQQTEMAARREQLRAEAAALAARLLELEASRRAAAARLEQRRQQLEAAAAAQSALEAALADARAAAAAGETALRAARATLETARQRLSDTEVALARQQSDLEHLAQTCRDELACELDTLAPPPLEEGAAAIPLADLDAAARELRRKIDALGPVNMMALEEHDEAQQRHVFLETQRKDLLDSIADTAKAIQEMDAISRQKFQEAFEAINQHFQEAFKTLFGGGQGFLRLSEMDGGSDQGVDIVAQPPGKKLQNALLLSGGEKAMVAMALLLAIFRYQPSPFCLLDEVDAPLDEANVGRFTAMLKQMSAETQFILITHNKRTMEAAATLYGVTMPQAGVSRLVSVLVEEAPRRAVAS